MNIPMHEFAEMIKGIDSTLFQKVKEGEITYHQLKQRVLHKNLDTKYNCLDELLPNLHFSKKGRFQKPKPNIVKGALIKRVNNKVSISSEDITYTEHSFGSEASQLEFKKMSPKSRLLSSP